MNDDPILDALRRRPSDEPDFDRPLGLPAEADRFAEPLTGLVPSMGLRRPGGSRPEIRSRAPIRALPALALAVVVAFAALVMLRSGSGARSGGLSAATPSEVTSTAEPTAPPQGLGAATWTLDTAYPYLPDATELHVVAQELECASGQSAAGRVVQTVVYESDRVVVTLAVRPPEGNAQTCQGNPPTPFVVRLDEPIADRSLYDGGTSPATLVAVGGVAVVMPSPTPYPSSWHEPMACSSDVEVAGFFKAAAMDLPFDVYCPVLPEGWTVKRTADGQVGTEQDRRLTVEFLGPAGESFGFEEGTFCEAAGSICDRVSAAPDPVRIGDLEAHMGQLWDGSWFAYTPPIGAAMYATWGAGMTRDEFVSILAGMIVVGR